ncbi:(2Fe-2S)-binding protein [bacterium]|nr:(2Fe-2S)-binding protein [bacterium]
MPTLKIDGKEITVESNTTIIEAAKKLGIDIPVFCYHEGLSIAANCRMCLVEVEVNGRKFNKPLPACHTIVSDGMSVQTDTPKVKKTREGVLEFLFLNHPIDCPICDQAGECYLQDHYMAHGAYESRLDTEKVKKNKAIPIGEHVILDSERCVLCSRCVRFTKEISKTEELAIFNRGNHSEIGVVAGKSLDNDYSLNVVDICPVGALTSRDFRFKKRVWYLKTTPSICTGCSMGCNSSIEYENGTIYRIKPRENRDVNGWWMCNEGRLLYHQINSNRLLSTLSKGNEISQKDALLRFVEIIKNHKNSSEKIGVVLSANLSTESAFAIKNLFQEFFGVKSFYINVKKDGKSDDLLIKADKNPNRKGISLVIGKENAEKTLKDAIKKHETLIFWGGDLPSEFDLIESDLKKVKNIILFATNKNILTDIADISFPITSIAQERGTFVNIQNRLQQFYPIEKHQALIYNPTNKGVSQVGSLTEKIYNPIEWLVNISKKMDYNYSLDSIFKIFAQMRKEIPQFANIEYKNIGLNGVLLEDK